MGEAADSRLTQLHEGTPGLAWWRDRAVRRKSTSGASATGPVSRRATSALSHRADEPPGPQAPGKQARLVHTDRTDRSGRGARMRCPGAPVLCLSPPLVALLLKRLAIRSGQSHPGLYTQSHQPGSGRRATVLARSDHSTAIGHSPSDVGVCHRVVWRHTCCSPVTRRAMRATQAREPRLECTFAS